MDQVRNPYSPGAGRRPAALVGRDTQLSAWDVAIRRAELDRTAQPPVLFGLRGVGKTVLLARVGVANGRAALDVGFFRSRWDRATPAEQRYLRAMAIDGDASSGSGDVASRLARRVTSLGPTRANLIAKGLIYAPEHGVVAFTVPGMAEFVLRQPQP